MRVLEINSVCGIRSTGRIAGEIAEEYEKQGHKVRIAYGRESVPEKYARFARRIGTEAEVRRNALSCRLFDNDGFTARQATREFLNWADEYDPDLLWLHNLHGYYINLKLLFDWIKARPAMEVKWTLHDCWSFTGHCTYFTVAGCDRWKTHCCQCPQKREYPSSYVMDQSSIHFEKKRALFTGIGKMTLITPSRWLADLVRQSFLSDYPVIIRNNTINTDVFKPTQSNIKEKLGLEDKHIVLGVAAQWQTAKGYDDFLALADRLPENYAVVMVGLTAKQREALPKRIVGIERTNSAGELAALYTAADVFFNPTYEDNYPTVNLEAKACGTKVITYKSGGSPESVEPDCVFEPGDLDAALAKIIAMCEENAAVPG